MPDADACSRGVESVQFAQQLRRLLDAVEDGDGRPEDFLRTVQELQSNRHVLVLHRDGAARNVLDELVVVFLQPVDDLRIERRRTLGVSFDVDRRIVERCGQEPSVERVECDGHVRVSTDDLSREEVRQRVVLAVEGSRASGLRGDRDDRVGTIDVRPTASKGQLPLGDFDVPGGGFRVEGHHVVHVEWHLGRDRQHPLQVAQSHRHGDGADGWTRAHDRFLGPECELE